MDSLHVLDLLFLGEKQEIGAYLLETGDGPALFDCGPATTLEHLRSRLDEHGLAVRDLRHLLLSHIHLDHAGAAGALVHENPKLTVWVSPIGAPHLVDPSRLEASARRLFGATFDTLWGPLTPVPEHNVRLAEGDVLGWEAFPTPGHASHHVSYFRDGTLLAGRARQRGELREQVEDVRRHRVTILCVGRSAHARRSPYLLRRPEKDAEVRVIR